MARAYLENIAESRFTDATIRRMFELVDQAKTDEKFQKLVYSIVNRSMPGQWKQYRQEIEVLLNWAKTNVDYRRDPHGVEVVQDVWATLDRKRADCVPFDQKIIVRNKATGRYEVVEIGSLRDTYLQYKALSYNFDAERWEFRDITRWIDKGKKQVFRVRIGNGTSFRCTGNHKLFAYSQWRRYKRAHGVRMRKQQHPFVVKTLNELNTLSRVHPSLAMAARIPCLDAIPGRKEDALWVHGLYVAEGWISVKPSGHISKVQIGGDGAVREKLVATLGKMGVPFSKSKREVSSSINLLESDFKDELRHDILGRYAYEKDLPEEFLSLGTEQIRSFMDGYGAGDDFVPSHGSWKDRVERVHNTTSFELAKKLMFFNRVLGKPCSLWTQKRHGGAGKTPMYRVLVWKRGAVRKQERYKERMPGVTNGSIKEIVPCGDASVCDITVEGTHNFVLENGVIAHNCDDFVVLTCSMAEILGAPCRMVTVSSRPDRQPTHVYALVFVEGAWHGVDAIMPNSYVGWEPRDGITDRKVWTRRSVGLAGDDAEPVIEGLGKMKEEWTGENGFAEPEGGFSSGMFRPRKVDQGVPDDVSKTWAYPHPGELMVSRRVEPGAEIASVSDFSRNPKPGDRPPAERLPIESFPSQAEMFALVDRDEVPKELDPDKAWWGSIPAPSEDIDWLFPRGLVQERDYMIDLAGLGNVTDEELGELADLVTRDIVERTMLGELDVELAGKEAEEIFDHLLGRRRDKSFPKKRPGLHEKVVFWDHGRKRRRRGAFMPPRPEGYAMQHFGEEPDVDGLGSFWDTVGSIAKAVTGAVTTGLIPGDSSSVQGAINTAVDNFVQGRTGTTPPPPSRTAVSVAKVGIPVGVIALVIGAALLLGGKKGGRSRYRRNPYRRRWGRRRPYRRRRSRRSSSGGGIGGTLRRIVPLAIAGGIAYFLFKPAEAPSPRRAAAASAPSAPVSISPEASQIITTYA